MRNPEIAAKISGENHWRHRPEYAERAAEYAEEQRVRMEGSSNPGWKGGRTVSSKGYVSIRRNGKYEREHRVVMEEHLGRLLTDNEVVHHIDGNVANNAIDNLTVYSQSEHASYHDVNRRILDKKDAPVCTCGCSELVTESQRRPGTWNWFVMGHQTRVREAVVSLAVKKTPVPKKN